MVLKAKPCFGDFLSVLWTAEPSVFSFHFPCSLGIIGIFCQTQDYLIFIFQRTNIFMWIVVIQQWYSKSFFERKKKGIISLPDKSLHLSFSELISLEALHLHSLARDAPSRHFWGKVPSRGLLLWEKKKVLLYLLLLSHPSLVSVLSCFKISQFPGNIFFIMVESGYTIRFWEIRKKSFQNLDAKFHQRTKHLFVTSGTRAMLNPFN